MEQKYLPIGSVCTLKGKNKKVMITGYYSVEFNGNLKINDYVGCVYPEGMLLPEQTYTFNHDDIEAIDFIGLKNDEFQTFRNLLDRLTGNEKADEEKAAEFHKENDMFLTSNSVYSKLLFDENGVVMIADPVEEPKKEIEEPTWNNIKFDKNGTVVSMDVEEVENPFYKEFENVKVPEQKHSSEWNIFNKIEFDENGTVISVEENKEENKEENNQLSKIEFDENGTVIAVNGDTLKEKNDLSKYKFDENGTLIAVEEDEEEIPAIGPGLPGYVAPENKKVSNYSFDDDGNLVAEETYEFDVNGNLVAQNKFELEQDEEEIPPIGPGLPGYVEPKKVPNYKFDEEGNVISE